MPIDTDILSLEYRGKAAKIPERLLLVSQLGGSEQEKDLTEPVNCNGYGRIRHFRRKVESWPSNPLPIDPAAKALGLPATDMIRAQVFQNAVCNWRCWYCYVPYNLLSASPATTKWMSPKDLVDLYGEQINRPPIIDLTGGQPDLVPEWVPWMIEELSLRGMEDVYLWSDDNLSNDFFWRFLSDKQHDAIVKYPRYGRVGCFKGFSRESFAFNTSADSQLYDRQFELMDRLVKSGIDMYAYTTLTTPTRDSIGDDMKAFVDHLQNISENLPLRTVPLKISVFTPVKRRMNDMRHKSLMLQEHAIEAWNREIESRFSSSMRAMSICDVQL